MHRAAGRTDRVLGLAESFLADPCIPAATVGALADRHYTVRAGDTLWQIAGHFYGRQRDLRQVVFTLEQANGLRGRVLQPGVDLRLPVLQ